MNCADLGPDLVARALGQLPDDAASAVESHLAACAACRDEAARLERALAAATETPAVPAPAARERLLAAVAGDAAERRARVASGATRGCDAVREDLPALVLGFLDAADRARVAAHAAQCADCAGETRFVETLVTTHRAAVRTAAPTHVRIRVLDAARAERESAVADARLHAVPPPPALRLMDPRRARARVRRLSMLIPLAAAASLLAAIAFTAPAVGLHVSGNVGALYLPHDGATSGRWIDRDAGEVRLRPGDGIAAGDRPVEVRLRFVGEGPASGADTAPAAGEVRLTLQPGTRLVRVDDRCLELEHGRVDVHSGRLDARLTIRHGPRWAAVVGTRFQAQALGERLIVSVTEGRVEVGGEGAGTATLGAGEDALVAPALLLTRRNDGRPAADAFLAPEVAIAAGAAKIGAGAVLELDAEIRAGPGGPVTVPVFDDSDPRLLIRLKGPDGRTVETKVGRSMFVPGPARPGGDRLLTVRLAAGAPWRFRLRVDGLRLEPGPWTASLRFQSYGPRADGAEWHGSVESPPTPFEVTRE